MPQLTADDKTRLTTKLEGLRARVKEIKADGNISPETNREMVSVRELVCADLEAILKPEASQ